MSKTVILCCLLLTLGSAQWLERQVVIGDTLGGIRPVPDGGVVVNPVSGNVYIQSEPTQIFNPVTKEKLRAIDVPGSVVFCPASGKGYIFDDYGSDSVLIVDAAADTVIGTAVFPHNATAFAYNPMQNRLYVGTSIRDTVYVFDPAGDTILYGVDVGASPRALLWDSAWNRLYVGTTADSARLAVVDCSADTLVADLPVGVRYMQAVALSTASHKLYVAGRQETFLVVVSTDSLKVVGTTPGLELSELLALVYNPVTDRLACLVTDSLCVIDCRADTIRTKAIRTFSSVAVNTTSGSTYLGRSDPTEVEEMDTSDNFVGAVDIPTVPTHSIVTLTFWPGSNELYGVTSPGDLAFIVDSSTDTLAGMISYANYSPRQMVHNPAANKLYLPCPGHDELLVIDSTFGTPKHILGGAYNSDAQTVLDPVLNRLYVADDDELRVIDCNTDSLVQVHHMHGINSAVPVMVPYLNKLYVFSGTGLGDSVYVYDCFRDTLFSVLYLTGAVPSAVYDPRSNRVFFTGGAAPLCALDPVTDSIVKTFDLVGGSADGLMVLNVDLGRLYYVVRYPEVLLTIDVLTDSVISSEDLPSNGRKAAMFLNRRLGKLYLCRSTQTLVFDCALGAVVDTVNAGFRYSGLMDDRNDKLYLNHGAVVDCRHDSVVAQLEVISPRSMAWDAIDNRVFQATTSRLYVYRDGPYGIEEQRIGNLGLVLAVLGNPARAFLRLRLEIPRGQTGALTVYDAAGRRVHSSSGLRTSSFAIDLRSMAAGIYFVRLKAGASEATAKVVVQR